jgi:peptide/nickel transport system substrate-binding protein
MSAAPRTRLLRPSLRSAYLVLLALGLGFVVVAWLATASAGSASGGRWTEGVVGAPEVINPLLAQPGTTDADLVALLFNGLIRIDADGTPLPDLAEHWEVTPDGRTYTFVLRDDLAWHDGPPVTTTDVAATIAYLQDPDFAGNLTLAANWAAVDTFVIDDRTILLRLPDPAADFLSRLTVGILPAHRFADVAAADLAGATASQDPIGTGPYRLASLNGERAVLEANTSYHRGAPNIERLELRFYPNATRQLEALSRGEIDAALRGEQPDPREAEVLADRDELLATPLVRHAFTILYLNNQQAPLDDPDLRRAIAASLDPAAVVRAAGIRGLPGDGVIVPGSWLKSDEPPPDVSPPAIAWATAGFDLDDEGRLVRDGVPLTLEIVTNADQARIDLAQAIADALEAVGVTVEVTPLPADDLLSRHLVPRDYQLALFGWEANVDPDPYLGWHTSQISESGRNIAGFQDATADALLEAARVTVDTAERRELYAAFEARFAEQAASVVLDYPTRLYIHPKQLRGFTSGLLFSAADRFRDVQRWSLEPGS